MWNKIGLFLPTYRRAMTKLPAHIRSFCTNASDRNNIYYVFIINCTDSASKSVITRMMGELGVAYEIITEYDSTPNLARFFNMAYSKSHNQNPDMLVSMIGDDMVCKTKDWDLRILEEVNNHDGMGVFYTAGDDRFDDALCVNAFMTRKWVEFCGGWIDGDIPSRFMAPRFCANGIDVVWQLIADATGLCYYIADVIIEHWQWSRPQIGHDETSQRLRPWRMQATRQSSKGAEVECANAILSTLSKKGIACLVDSAHLRPIVKGRAGRHWCYKDKEVII